MDIIISLQRTLGQVDYYGGYADICIYEGYAYIFYEHCREGKVEQLVLSRIRAEEEKG